MRLPRPKELSQRVRDVLALVVVLLFCFAYWSSGKPQWMPFGFGATLLVVAWFLWSTLNVDPDEEE